MLLPSAAAAAPSCAPALSSPHRRPSRRRLDPIQAARDKLDELVLSHRRFLTRRAHLVLREYLRLADLRNPGLVFETSSDSLETVTGYSKRSVSGANSDLVAAGLIERPAPDMKGRKTPVWRTVLTPRCMALFFGHHTQEVAPPQDKEPNSFESQGATPAVEEEAPKTEQPRPAELADGQTIHVREDLRPLLAVMQPVEIRQVLGIARDAGVWVQDVMSHRLDAILKARQPKALLIKLIHSGDDWKRPAARREPQASAPASESVAEPSTLAGWREDAERRRRDAEHQAALDREHLAAQARAARAAARALRAA